MKYSYTGISVRHTDGTLAQVADCELDVKFPADYNHLESVESPIAGALFADLKECGVDADEVYYTATCEKGDCEERVFLKLGANHARLA